MTDSFYLFSYLAIVSCVPQAGLRHLMQQKRLCISGVPVKDWGGSFVPLPLSLCFVLFYYFRQDFISPRIGLSVTDCH